MAADHIDDTYDAGKLWGDMLFSRLATGQEDEQQKALWERWLAENPSMKEDLYELDDMARLKILVDRYRLINTSGADAYQTFLSMRSDHPEKHRPYRKLYYYLSGAAAAILLTFSIALFVHRSRPVVPAPTAAVLDLAPGSNKAVLTLAGGQTVLLDSAHSGLIRQQGGAQIINRAGGLLAYKEEIGNHNPQLYNTITTGRGGQYRVVLSDGTRVWLDAASSLHYPTAFTGGSREVTLTGQGYFEVAHHAQPFIVHTDRADVQDLGTAFNVNAYPEEGGVVTTLVEGSVRVLSSGKARTLTPGQQATAAAGLRVEDDVNVDDVVAWKEGRFQFTGVPFGAVLQSLSRWYDVDVIDHAHLTQHIVITLSRNEPLSSFMNSLELTNKLSYRITDGGKTLIIERP
jgi:ferric-dicitrate binding protein FerR (iron transport regulator)